MTCEANLIWCNGSTCIPERPDRGREQSIVARGDDPGGVTLREAIAIGWLLLTDDEALCPFCPPDFNEYLIAKSLVKLFISEERTS